MHLLGKLVQGLKPNQTHYLERWNLLIPTRDKPAALLVSPTNWRHFPDQIGILVFKVRGKPEYPEQYLLGREEIQQQTILCMTSMISVQRKLCLIARG